MFRCDNCGSGYSMRAASSWDCCPRCLAREKVNVPLSFELGWGARRDAGDAAASRPQPAPSVIELGRDRDAAIS